MTKLGVAWSLRPAGEGPAGALWRCARDTQGLGVACSLGGPLAGGEQRSAFAASGTAMLGVACSLRPLAGGEQRSALAAKLEG